MLSANSLGWFNDGGIVNHLEDAVPDMGELVVPSVPVQVQVEHAYVYRLPDASPVLVCITIQYPYTV